MWQRVADRLRTGRPLRSPDARRMAHEATTAAETARASPGERFGATDRAADARDRDDRIRAALRLLDGALGAPWGLRRRARARLPWVLVIGPSGAGKSALLRAADLRRPTARGDSPVRQQRLAAVDQAEWSVADAALFVEAPARYLDADESGFDAACWRGFLRRLARCRPGLPLNGVLVVVSVTDLLPNAESRRQLLGERLREQLLDLHDRLGVRSPIHLVVTHMGWVKGFDAFFTDLGREERRDAWGIEIDAQAIPSARLPWAEEFDALVERQRSRLLARLASERDPRRREALFAFPRQLAALRPGLLQLLEGIDATAAFDEPLSWGGAWFVNAGGAAKDMVDIVTSETARSLDVTVRALTARDADLSPVAFVDRLLTEVVPSAARRTLLTRRARRARTRRIVASTAMGAALLAGFAALRVHQADLERQSLVALDRRVDAVEARLGALPTAADASLRDTWRLIGMADELAASSARGAPSRWPGFGIDHDGRMRVAQRAQDLLRRLVDEAWMPRLANRIQDRLAHPRAEDDRYEVLRVARMLEVPGHRDVGAVLDWARADDTGRSSGREWPPDAAALEPQAVEALSSMPFAPSPSWTARIEEARDHSQGQELADLAWARLTAPALGNDKKDGAIRLSDLAGPAAARVFRRVSGAPLSESIPARFTAQGRREADRAAADVVRTLAGETSWVLGGAAASENDLRAATDEVRARLTAKALTTWERLLSDLRFADAPGDAVGPPEALALGTGEGSPLRRLLEGVAREATEEEAAPAGPSPAPQASPVRPLPEDPRIVLAVSRFAAWRQLVTPLAAAGGPAGATPVDRMLDALREVGVQWRAAAEAPTTAATVPALDAAIARVRSLAAEWPQPMRAWFDDLLDRARGRLDAGRARDMRAAIKGDAGNLCRQSIERRYPFEAGADRETPLGDFVALFAPNGLLDRLTKERLEPYVDTSVVPWRTRPGAPAGDGLEPGTIASLERAAALRDAFFGPVSATGTVPPAATADLVLVASDPGIAEVRLEVDGQASLLKPGSGIRVAWPPRQPSPRARLAVIVSAAASSPASGTLPMPPAGDTQRDLANFEGTWSLFRLVEAGHPVPDGPERLALTFGPPGAQVVLDWRSDSVRNPWRLASLRSFRCPH
jgi:type VI secretion system protein ImpL